MSKQRVRPYDRGRFYVESFTERDAAHIVDTADWSCTCRAGQLRGNGRNNCSHRKAVQLYALKYLRERQGEAENRVVHSETTEAPAGGFPDNAGHRQLTQNPEDQFRSEHETGG